MVYIDAYSNSDTNLVPNRKYDRFNFKTMGPGIGFRVLDALRVFGFCRGGDRGGGFQFPETFQTTGPGIPKAERAYRAHGVGINR